MASGLPAPESGISRQYQTLRDWEEGAGTFKNWEANFVPGLLQTEAYATRVIHTLGGRALSDTQMDNLIRIRMDRQHRALGNLTTSFTFAMGAEAIYRTPSELREEQDSRLDEFAGIDNISVHILPLSAGLQPGMAHPFVLVEHPDRGNLLHIEVEGGLTRQVVREPGDSDPRTSALFDSYSEAFDRLVAASIDISEFDSASVPDLR